MKEETDRPRDRSDSIKKRKLEAMKETEEERELTRQRISEELEEFLMDDKNRFSRAAALYVMKRFRKMEELLVQEEIRRAEVEGMYRALRIASISQPQVEKPKLYGDLLKAPKVRNKQIKPRDPETVVLTYPTDETKTDSDSTKKILKEALASKTKTEGLQFKAIRKIQKGV